MNEVLRIDENLKVLGGMFPQVLVDLERYRDNHRFLLILSCSFAELLVSVLIDRHCKHSSDINDRQRDYPLSVRLTLLHDHYIWLTWLRRQRNDAAHRADFKFTDNLMPPWGGADHKSADKLFSLCVNILSVIWNRHVELFRDRLPLNA